jgi:hypothetical protein
MEPNKILLPRPLGDTAPLDLSDLAEQAANPGSGTNFFHDIGDFFEGIFAGAGKQSTDTTAAGDALREFTRVSVPKLLDELIVGRDPREPGFDLSEIYDPAGGVGIDPDTGQVVILDDRQQAASSPIPGGIDTNQLLLVLMGAGGLVAVTSVAAALIKSGGNKNQLSGTGSKALPWIVGTLAVGGLGVGAYLNKDKIQALIDKLRTAEASLDPADPPGGGGGPGGDPDEQVEEEPGDSGQDIIIDEDPEPPGQPPAPPTGKYLILQSHSFIPAGEVVEVSAVSWNASLNSYILEVEAGHRTVWIPQRKAEPAPPGVAISWPAPPAPKVLPADPEPPEPILEDPPVREDPDIPIDPVTADPEPDPVPDPEPEPSGPGPRPPLGRYRIFGHRHIPNGEIVNVSQIQLNPFVNDYRLRVPNGQGGHVWVAPELLTKVSNNTPVTWPPAPAPEPQPKEPVDIGPSEVEPPPPPRDNPDDPPPPPPVIAPTPGRYRMLVSDAFIPADAVVRVLDVSYNNTNDFYVMEVAAGHRTVHVASHKMEKTSAPVNWPAAEVSSPPNTQPAPDPDPEPELRDISYFKEVNDSLTLAQLRRKEQELEDTYPRTTDEQVEHAAIRELISEKQVSYTPPTVTREPGGFIYPGSAS